MPEAVPSRNVGFMDFWSVVDNEFLLNTTADAKALPDVVVAGIPAGSSIIRVIAMFECRAIEDTSAAQNAINGTQYIQVRLSGGLWTNAIQLTDNMWLVATNTREGGDVVIGAIDISGVVTGNGTYNLRTNNVVVDGNNLQLNDVQVGLRIYFI